MNLIPQWQSAQTDPYFPIPIQEPTRLRIGPLSRPLASIAEPCEIYGAIKALTERVRGTYIYNWRVALAGTPEVTVAMMQTRQARTEFTGLTRGGIYLVQVNAVGAAGTTEWSDAANITAP